MTIATRAPVIMPSMATPNRMSNHPTTRPPGDVTNAGVALAQHRRDPPVERVEDRLERPRLLEQRDDDRGDDDECDDPLGEGQEEPSVELTADATDVPGDAADQGGRQDGKRQTGHRGAIVTHRGWPMPARIGSVDDGPCVDELHALEVRERAHERSARGDVGDANLDRGRQAAARSVRRGQMGDRPVLAGDPVDDGAQPVRIGGGQLGTDAMLSAPDQSVGDDPQRPQRQDGDEGQDAATPTLRPRRPSRPRPRPRGWRRSSSPRIVAPSFRIAPGAQEPDA